MLPYLLRRFAIGATTFFVVTGLSFLLLFARGGLAIAADLTPENLRTLEAVTLKAEQLGLDRAIPVQYFDWLSHLLRGDLGTSFGSGVEVANILSVRIPVTVSLAITTLVLMTTVGVFLGVLAARRGGLLDKAVQAMSVAMTAVPAYWLALVLVIIFSLNLGLFPATGFIPVTQSFPGWLSTVALPTVALALGPSFVLAVWIRSSIVDMQRSDFVRTLRARGISDHVVMYRHVLRNASAPSAQLLGLMIITILGGTIIVERVFALPGIGTMTMNAGLVSDIPVVLGGITFFVAVITVINVAVDVVVALLNPKVRIS